MNALPLLLVAAAGATPQYDGQLLDFTATWCGPCQRMSPIVHRLQQQGYPVRQVDIDQERSLAQQYGVTNIPAFVLVVNGKIVDRVVGVTSETKLRQMVARIPKKSPQFASTQPRSTPNRSNPPRTAVAATENHLGDPADFPGTVRANIDQTDPGFEAPIPPGVGGANGADPNGASVRIRVVDGEGVNFGSGTIIESKRGRATLLSCGHVFRDLAENSRIEVDVFQWENGEITGRETFVGEIVAYDLDADVGLLTIPAERRLPVCPIARVAAKVSDAVLNIGCSRGELPTRESIRVKQLNRYLGPDNLECTGVPVVGRSGGGLFNTNGEIVGVCVARDPRDKEGIYAGLKAIHELLEQQDYAYLYRAVDQRDGSEFVSAEPTPARRRNADLPADATELLDEADEAEVICIIRKHGEPESRSRVVIINRASSKFVSYLSGEMRDQPRLTSDHIGRETRDADDRDAMEKRLEGSGWQILRKPFVERTPAEMDETYPSRTTPDEFTPEQRDRPPQRYRRSAASRFTD